MRVEGEQELFLEVGKYYRNRNGQLVKIIKATPNERKDFHGIRDDKLVLDYFSDGNFFTLFDGSAMEANNDLMEEIPAEEVPAWMFDQDINVETEEPEELKMKTSEW